MILKTDEQQKLEKFRKNKDESFTVKTSEDLPVRLALAVCYSNDTWHENEYFCYTWEDCLDDFVEKMNEILGDFEAFPRKKMIPMTYSKKEKFGAAILFYLCGEKFNRKNKNFVNNFVKAKNHCHYVRGYWDAAYLLGNLQCKEHSSIPLLGHKSSGFWNKIKYL